MSILVLEEFASDFSIALGPVARECDFASDPAAVSKSHEILLAQPALAADYLSQGHRPAWIQSTWAGVTPIVDVARERDILVTGVKGVFGAMMAEYVMAHILRDSQRLDAFGASQSASTWQPDWPHRLGGRTMVVAGTGSIGSHIATVAGGFGIHTVGVSRRGAANPAFHRVVPTSDLALVAAEADYLVLVLPDTAKTRDLVDADVLAALGRDAMLINVGRGSTVAEAALLQSLDEGGLRHAVLDVFQEEPLPPAHPFWRHPRVTVTPHIAAVSHPEDVVKIFLDNLARYRAGETLQHRVNLEAGY